MLGSNKRVAVLSPVAWRTPPRQYGAWETVASNITEGLVSRESESRDMRAQFDADLARYRELTAQRQPR